MHNPHPSKNHHDEDEDLDAEFAQFERQIQAVVAATVTDKQAAQQPQPQPQPQPEPSKPNPSPNHASPSANNSAPSARWKWDGTAWRWHTSTSPNASNTSAAPVVSAVAPLPLPLPPPSPTARVAYRRPSQSTAPNPAIVKRTAAGSVWHDYSLADFPPNDHRVFVGDLAPDASEQLLDDAFVKYPSFNMSRVVRHNHSPACKGYGFLSFADARDMLRAIAEMNGKYVAGRPLKLSRSKWQKRALKGKWSDVKALRTISKRKA